MPQEAQGRRDARPGRPAHEMGEALVEAVHDCPAGETGRIPGRDYRASDKEKILEWYLRRWEIEVSFRDMKTTLGYEFIRGRTPHIVKLELGVLVLAYNLLRYVIARGQAPGKRYAARRSLAKAFAMLVAAVAADALKRRKRKNYVRAVKRRPKPYPLLTKPRSEYRPEEII